MWGALGAFLAAVLRFLFGLAAQPASSIDAQSPRDLTKELQDEINDLPPTPDD
jgi:hypothetical protein